jgi:tRNA nucleotidyltransferase (CCA-adding enzyme)
MQSRTNLLSSLYDALHPGLRDALEGCIRLCEAREAPLFLVGGAVRDLMLGRTHIDLDLMTETDTAAIAEELARLVGGKAVTHERFGTATVKGPRFQLDLARARAETYSRPGALPDVRPARLTDDLRRRDFTINAMALRLTEPAGELIDPFGGSRDLKSRLVRVLHDTSFQDDATRMLRAVRYAARLEFKLERHTEQLVMRDLSYVDSISSARLRRELRLMFEERAASRSTQLASDRGLLRAVHPALGLSPAVAARWHEALEGRYYAPLDELGFCLVLQEQDESNVASVSKRLDLAGRWEASLRAFVRLQDLSDKLASVLERPADAVEFLESYQPAAVWAMSIADEGPAGASCASYLQEWRSIRPELTGADVLELGVPPGEAVGRVLRQLRRARLEGEARSREDEVRLVRERQTG